MGGPRRRSRNGSEVVSEGRRALRFALEVSGEGRRALRYRSDSGGDYYLANKHSIQINSYL